MTAIGNIDIQLVLIIVNLIFSIYYFRLSVMSINSYSQIQQKYEPGNSPKQNFIINGIFQNSKENDRNQENGAHFIEYPQLVTGVFISIILELTVKPLYHKMVYIQNQNKPHFNPEPYILKIKVHNGRSENQCQDG